MRSLNSLALRNLTAHPLRTVLTALAITLGVAMVLAASIIGQAAGGSASQLADGKPRIDLEISARDSGSFDESVLDAVRASPSVEQAAPSLHLKANTKIGELTLLGVAPQTYLALHKLELANGAFLNSPDSIVLPMALALDNNLNVGDELVVSTSARTVTLRIAGRLHLEQDIRNFADQTTAFIPLAAAQTLRASQDSKGLVIDHIEIALRPGADIDEAKAELARAIGGQFAIARTMPEGGLMGNTLMVQAGLVMVGLIILFAASFVILNAFGMSITARTREIGALRALGMTRRQVMNTVLAEAGLLGLAGVVAGVLVGLGLAWGVMRAMGTLKDAPFSMPAWSVILSAVMGILVTLLAALQPAWRASRVPPIVAVRPEGGALTQGRSAWRLGVQDGRIGAALLGLVITGIAAFGLLARPSILVALAAMVVGQAALLGATVLLLPALVGPINVMCRPVLVRWLGAAGRLASDNIDRNRSRAVLTAGALTAGLTIIAATSGLMTAGFRGALGRLGLMLHENTFITLNISSVITSGEMSVENFFQYISENPNFDLQPVIRALDPLVQEGVIQIERCRFAPVPPELGSVPGVPGIFVDAEPFLQVGNFEFHEGDPETALQLMRRGRAVLVPPIVAERLGVKVGDSFPLQTPHGEVAFTIAGIGGNGWMMTILPYTDGQSYFDVTAPTHIGIIVNRGQDVGAAMRRVRQTLETFPTMAMSADYNGVFDPLMGMLDRLSLLLNALVLLAVVVATLGVVNTMVINVSERGRELGLLRAVGATQRQVRQAVVAEAATLGLLAAAVADGLGLLMLLTFGALILPNGTTSIGVRGDWQTVQMTLGAGLRDWGLAAVGGLIFGPLIAALAAYWPARQAAAIDVVEATRSEQVVLRKTYSVPRKYAVRDIPIPGAERSGTRYALRTTPYVLAWRNLQEHRARAILSALAVTLAVAMTIAADVIGRSLITLLTQVEDVRVVGAGLFGQVDTVLSMIGLAVSAAAGFMVLNAFLMSATQRRRQVGMLRSLGMTRGQVMRLMLVEALMVGGAGTLLGVVGGLPFAWLVQALLKAFGGPMFNAWSGGSSSPERVLFAAGLGLGTSLAAVLVPAWRAARVSPLEALRESETSVFHRNPLLAARAGATKSVKDFNLTLGVLGVLVKIHTLGLMLLAAIGIYLAIAPPARWVWSPLDLILTIVFMLLWLVGLALALPGMIDAMARLARGPLKALWGAAGRLAADNLGRGSARGRMMLTILTLAVGLTMMVGLTGGMRFLFGELFGPTFARAVNRQMFVVSIFDPSQGVAGYAGLESLRLPPGAAQDIKAAVGERGAVLTWDFVIAPETAFFPNYFSFVLSPQDLQIAREWAFVFSQGDWEHALPIMESGCGILTTPLVARNNGVGLYDHLTVTSRRGPLDCVVAGIGQPYVNATIVSANARESFELSDPFVLVVSPAPGVDRQQLMDDVRAVTERRGLLVIDLDDLTQLITQTTNQLGAVASALLILAIVAAALGMVNTTLMSIAERRRELGLLRAVGATRRQTLAIITGEAALIGLLGGVVGSVAGLGLTVILATVYGGNAWGVPDLDVWAAAWRSIQPALLTGLIGLLAAPFICALAAWLPARSILRGAAIETLNVLRTAYSVSRQPTIRSTQYAIRSTHYVLAWRNLTAHSLRSILTALAITLGVAMILAASIIGQAANQSAAQLVQAGPRADLEIFSRNGAPFDRAMLETLRAWSEVETALPSLRVQVTSLDPKIDRLTLLGVEAAAYQALYNPKLASGAFLDKPDSIVLPGALALEHNLRVGDEVTLSANEQEVKLIVGGQLETNQDWTEVEDASVAYVPLETLWGLGNPKDMIDRIEIKLRPGANIEQTRSRLSAQLQAPLAVARISASNASAATLPLVQVGLAVVGAMMLLAAAFVIMNAFAMSVTGRMQEIGSLRALGMTRRQITSLVLTEAGALGLAGAGLGLPLGLGLAWGVMAARGTLGRVPYVVPWWGVAVSVTLGLAMTFLGALQPALRAGKISPLEALRTAGKQELGNWYTRYGGRVGGIWLLVLLLGLAATSLIFRPDFFSAFGLLLIALIGLLAGAALILPTLVQLTARLARPVLVRWLGAPGRLAADNLARNVQRTVLTTSALAIGLLTIIASSSFVAMTLKSALNIYFGLFHEDGMIMPNISEMLASGELSAENSLQTVSRMKLDPAAVDAVTRLDVGTVVYYGFGPVQSELSTYPGAPGMFIDPDIFLPLGNFDFFEGDATSAQALMRQGHAVLLMPLLAEKFGVHVGDTIPVQTQEGELEFTVAGIGGAPTNFTTFSYADGQRYFGLTGPAWLGIALRGDNRADIDAVLARVQAALAPFNNVIVFDMREAGVGGLIDMVDRVQLLFNALLMLAVVVASLGMVNTMVINVTERRREIALLRAVGATQHQVRLAVAAEAATVGLFAALAASSFALVFLLLWLVIFAPNGAPSVGVRITWETAGQVLLPALREWGLTSLLSLILGPLVAALAAYYPARQAAAMKIVEATRSEQVTLKPSVKPGPEQSRRGQTSSTSRFTSHVLPALAWRNLQEHRARTILSALAVALGVMMIVAADVIGSAIRNAGRAIGEAQRSGAFVGDYLNNGLLMISAVILAVAGFIVFNAFAMSVTQRQRQIGMLRSLGMTRGQVMRLLLVEALMVGGGGALLGLILGPLLGRGLVMLMGQIVHMAYGQSSLPILSSLLALALGIGVALLAVLFPARRAARISPLAALREQTVGGKSSPVGWALGGMTGLVLLALWLILAPPGEWALPPMNMILAGLCMLLWAISLALIMPGLLSTVGRWAQRPLAQLGGAAGRLAGHNLQRNRGRVMLTMATLIASLAMIVAVTGILNFMMKGVYIGLFGSEFGLDEGGRRWLVYPMPGGSGGELEIDWEMMSNWDVEKMQLTPDFVRELESVVQGKAELLFVSGVMAPETAIIPGFSSYLADVGPMQRGDLFHFYAGDWDHAIPIMQAGCGLLLTPGVARRNNVWLYDKLVVTGARGPVECTVAGIGANVSFGASFISRQAAGQFGVAPGAIFGGIIMLNRGADGVALRRDIAALFARYPACSFYDVAVFADDMDAILDGLLTLFNGMLALAILAAALGVVNTTMMSIAERRRELGLLRAVGATRRQILVLIVGEAALMGIVGGVVGWAAGAGITVIYVTTVGVLEWGLHDVALWPLAWRAVQSALLNGGLGLMIAPLVCAVAAYWPARSILRGPAIETMNVSRIAYRVSRIAYRASSGYGIRSTQYAIGAIQKRFALGTAILMLVVLAGLIAVVVEHTRSHFAQLTFDKSRQLVAVNAGLIELSLPKRARQLDWNTLRSSGAFGNDQSLSQFKSLKQDMQRNGLLDLTIADNDNIILVNMEIKKIGQLAPPLRAPDQTSVVLEDKNGRPVVQAAAPIRNRDGLVLGSVRVTADAHHLTDLQSHLWSALGGVGLAMVVIGVLMSLALSAPLARAAQHLAGHAAQVRRGQYTLFEGLPGLGLGDRIKAAFSVQARLTIALVLLMVAMVGALEFVAIPVERYYVEDMLKNNVTVWTEWIAHGASTSKINLAGLMRGRTPSQFEMMEILQSLDMERLQQVSNDAFGQDVAYAALVNNQGEIVFSDQLALIDELAPAPTETTIEDSTWRGESVWTISTPLRQGEGGEQLGVLRVAVRRAQVDDFLNESRDLFALCGLAAILAGVLMAQAIGGAVAAPVSHLAEGARRVARGDLSVRFRVGTRDELAILANAYNQMVEGLREREWLRDMFGRFVSQEVAEAIRTGQVRLEGENRTVSVLFCDIRGFTSRSEKSTPEKIVALLNEYLPVVVEAAQHHSGTVNKFGGDSTLVIYGAPRRLQESAYQAVLTALEMRANLQSLNARLAARGEAPIRIGVGINTGVALAGAVGPKERQEYTVIGDTVNLASRIESLNKDYPHYDILISGQTYNALGSRRSEFELVDLGDVAIRGKEAPVRVWAVVSRLGQTG